MALFLALGALSAFAGDALQPCGNGNQGGGAGKNSPVGGDPIVIFTGNEFRNIDDLEVWGGVGQHQLRWSRWSNSRLPDVTTSYFGNAHNWRHAYQYEVTLGTGMVWVGKNLVNTRKVTVSLPDGTANTFTPVGGGVWRSTPAVQDILLANADESEFQMRTAQGWVYRFTRAGSPQWWGTAYRLADFTDATGNTYTLAYDAAGRFSRVTEPAGRYLQVTYGALNHSGFGAIWQSLCTVAQAPAAGQWSDVACKNTGTYRYIRLRAKDGSPVHAAEIEFYDNQNVKIAGVQFGASPSPGGQDFSKAFDGDTGTVFSFESGNGGFAGLDVSPAWKVVSKIRIFPAPGHESELAGAVIEGSQHGIAAKDVITRVETSDGRAVTYTYQQETDAAVPSLVWQKLAGASYGDGTAAAYTYAQVLPGTRPLLASNSDPRYRLPFVKTRSVYFDSQTSVLGQIHFQTDWQGNVLSELGIGADTHAPRLSYPWGGVQEYTMPAGGRPTAFRDGLGRRTTMAYDADGQGYLVSETDPLGRTTTYTRTTQGNIATKTLPDGTVEAWTYDERERPLGVTVTGAGISPRTTTLTRDALGRVVRVDYPDGSFEAFTYNAFAQPLTHRKRGGGVETFTYDARGLPATRTDAAGGVTSYSHDAGDRLCAVTDARGNTTSLLYNERGLVTRITHPDGTARARTYDEFGNLLAETDEGGNVWSRTYDDFRRIVSATDPLGRTTRTVYQPGWFHPDKMQSVVLPSGRATAFAYDAELNLTARTEGADTPDAATTAFTYNAANLPATATDALGHTTAFAYDNRDRKISETDPLGNISRWTYDAAGNVLSAIRSDGGTTANTYDAMDRLIQTTDPKAQTTAMAYDPAGNPAAMTDPRGNTYSWEHDPLDRPTAMIYPGGSREQYGYDAAGNMVSYTNRAGAVRSAVFDSRNRETQATWSDGTPGVATAYDAVGRVLSISNSVAASTFSYDAANQLLSENIAINGLTGPKTVAYTYDADGNRATLTDPAGSVIAYGYTGRGQVAAINADGPPPLATFVYDLAGRRASRTLENGITSTNTYDANGRLTLLAHGTVEALTYTYDMLNRRTGETRSSAPARTFGYDLTSQLTAVNQSGGNATFAYDAVGNRTIVTGAPGAGSYTANSLNQYTGAGDVVGALGYDANGNLATAGGWTYAHNGNSRLVAASGPGSTSANFGRDGRNRDVKRTINGTTTYLVYDGWNLVAEYDADGGLTTQYIHGPQVDEILAKVTPTSTTFPLPDALGSTVAVTDASGAVLERVFYSDAFGTPTFKDSSGTMLTGSTTGTRFLFTGREWLAALNLYDYRNRTYSAELGRFLQTDPIRLEAGDVNLYRYCANSPVNFIDPSGLAIVVNNTGSGVVISGNVGSGHGAGSQAFGVIPAGATGGGAPNPVTGYPTRDEAIDAATPNFIGPHRPLGPITDVDYYDDPCAKHRSNTEADNKLIGDEEGPTFDLNLKNGKIVPDAHNLTLPGAYGRRLREKIGNLFK